MPPAAWCGLHLTPLLPGCVAHPADERMHMNMQLRATLEALNARAMVVGHTPQMSGVNCECDGRVWRADAGMSSGVLDAAPQVRCCGWARGAACGVNVAVACASLC